jgi:hypothetical protein
VSKSKLEQAEKVLVKYNGHVADYDVHEEIVRRLRASWSLQLSKRSV